MTIKKLNNKHLEYSSNMKELTIIIPAYNEELGIADTLNTLIPFAKENNWEIILINDGSTDNTSAIINSIEGINVIEHTFNKGYGAALKTGINNTKTELVAMYDADGQHTPEDMKKLHENFTGYDMLVGKRGKDSHQDWMRKPGKWVLSKVANSLAERKIPDLNSGLRIIKHEVISKYLHLMPNSFSFSTTSTIALMNLGFNVGYHPIIVKQRVGVSSVKQLKHGSNTILLILRLVVLFNPLKIFNKVSKYLFITGIIYEIIWGIILLPDGVRLIPAALFLLLSSVIVFLFGLVVDQISELRKHDIMK